MSDILCDASTCRTHFFCPNCGRVTVALNAEESCGELYNLAVVIDRLILPFQC